MLLGPGLLALVLFSAGISRMALEELLFVVAVIIRRVWPGEAAVVGNIS